MKLYDTMIIGAGIAGITAALFAARKRMGFEIVASEFGGQMLISGEVHNYPGLPDIPGLELRAILEKQLALAGGPKAREETVIEIKRSGLNFKVMTDKNMYEAQTVIIATGSKPKKLDVLGEERLARKGVAYCSICDGPLFSGMEVAIIGGGNSALHAVDFMKDIASKIYLVARSDRTRGFESLLEKAKKNPKVKIIFNADVKEILGGRFVSGIRYEQGGKQKELKVGGVIVEIGRTPGTGPFRGLLDCDEAGHIKTDCQGQTSMPGIFAAGDCTAGHDYQYIISAGQGCMALLRAARYLATKK